MATFWRNTDQKKLSGEHSIMMEKQAQAGEGGVKTHPLSLFLPSRKKLKCTLQLKGRFQNFVSTLDVLCGTEVTREKEEGQYG